MRWMREERVGRREGQGGDDWEGRGMRGESYKRRDG
jgi:hypothetical protein